MWMIPLGGWPKLDSVLGPTFPYFASVGNHDVASWDVPNGYADVLRKRYENMGAAPLCKGDIGVNMACYYKGLLIVYSGVGTLGTGHVEYLDQVFSNTSALWRVCSFHKNQQLMQIGGQADEVGWEVYDTCRKHGAIVATAHEHTYSRTYLMNNFETQQIANTQQSPLRLAPEQSFVFVSALGGHTVSHWKNAMVNNPWWAAVGASNNGIGFGGLYCQFNIDGQENKAHCEQKDTNGSTWDTFDIYTYQTMRAKSHVHRVSNEKWRELQVSSSSNNVVEYFDTGRVDSTMNLLHIASPNNQVVALRFENIPVSKGEKIDHVYLQVYGAEEGLGSTSITISAELSPNSQRIATIPNSIRSRPHTQSISWTLNRGLSDHWERHEVWVSPDLREIVEEVIAQPEWEKNNAITFFIRGSGDRIVYSFEANKCLAPSLVFEMK